MTHSLWTDRLGFRKRQGTRPGQVSQCISSCYISTATIFHQGIVCGVWGGGEGGVGDWHSLVYLVDSPGCS